MWKSEDFPVAMDFADTLIGNMAKRKDLEFKVETRNVVAKEIIHRCRARKIDPEHVVQVFSPEELEYLVIKLPTVASARVVTPGIMGSLILNQKIEQLEANLDTDVIAPVRETNVFADREVQDLIRQDVLERTKRMATSGLDANEIAEANREFLLSIMRLARGPLTARAYRKIRPVARPFPDIVKVRVTSEPSGAHVELEGLAIGDTELTKPIECGREYTFRFSLQDYETAVRHYYVEPYPFIQDVHEDLLPRR